MTRHHRIVIAFALSCFVTACQFDTAAASELWTYSSEKNIKWYQITPPSVAVVCTDNGLYGIDPATGNLAWELPECKGLGEDRFGVLNATPLALIYLEKNMRGKDELLVLIDVRTGAELWTSAKFGIAKAKGCILLPPIGGLLVYGEKSGDKKGRLGVAIDLQTGDILWQKEAIFEDWEPPLINGNQPPLFDSDSTMILYLNKKSVRKYDLRTGELIWETSEKLKPRKEGVFAVAPDERECAALTFGYAPMALDEELGLIYVPFQNSIAAFKVSDGSSVWEKPPKVPDMATQVEVTPQGVLVRAVSSGENPAFELLMFDKNTGNPIWKAPSKKGSIFKQILGTWVDCSNFVVANGQAFVCVEGRLRAMHLETGELREVAKLEFRNSEQARGLEWTGNGFVAASAQNASWFDEEGQLRRHVFFEPPENVDLGLGLLAAAFAVNQIGGVNVGNDTRVSAKASYSPGFKELMREFSASAESNQHLYFLTYLNPEEYSDPGLVKVDKLTGDTAGSLPLDTKEPDYRVDRRADLLFLKSDKKTINCFRF